MMKLEVVTGRHRLPVMCASMALAWAPLLANAAEDARALLEKMNRALAMRNYDGTFFHLSNGRVETMRIVHRVQHGRVMERLVSLDGSQREVVRNGEELTCYLPDQRTVVVEPLRTHGPLLGTLPQFGEGGLEFYTLESLPRTRLLGHAVQGVSVRPKDKYRFGYKLWLDEQSGMPLKTQLCDADGQVLEQIQFARIDMPESIPDSAFVPATHADGMRWVRQQNSAPDRVNAISAFRVSRLPPGFKLTSSGAQTLGDAAEPASHLVYSDGLASVSVFIEQQQSRLEPMYGVGRVGGAYTFSTVIDGHQVTAVGEVPAETVEFIAHSVQRGLNAVSGPGQKP
jgi:sigma-E factor negative regulatory protein RseB